MLKVELGNDILFFIDELGDMYLMRDVDIICLGKESSETLEQFISNLYRVIPYLQK